jgi:hypothetical protein
LGGGLHIAAQLDENHQTQKNYHQNSHIMFNAGDEVRVTTRRETALWWARISKSLSGQVGRNIQRKQLKQPRFK